LLRILKEQRIQQEKQMQLAGNKQQAQNIERKADTARRTKQNA
jgi:hypothetical protein